MELWRTEGESLGLKCCGQCIHTTVRRQPNAAGTPFCRTRCSALPLTCLKPIVGFPVRSKARHRRGLGTGHFCIFARVRVENKRGSGHDQDRGNEGRETIHPRKTDTARSSLTSMSYLRPYRGPLEARCIAPALIRSSAMPHNFLTFVRDRTKTPNPKRHKG